MLKTVYAFAVVLLALAAGGEAMLDIPVPSNQSIIVFSAIGNQPEGAGRLRQGIAFTAETAITVTGGVETNYVRVTPSGAGFAVVCKGNYAAGETTFDCTATTAGDPERGLEAASASFTFRVLVLGSDFPHLMNGFHEFPVGADVEAGLSFFYAAPLAMLNIPKTVSPIVSQTHGIRRTVTDPAKGDISYDVWEGTESGLYLSPVLDQENTVRGATIKGRANRPGIYYRAFNIDSYDREGDIYAFPGNTSSALLIINIYDDRESPKLLSAGSHVHNPDFIRVIRHGLEDDYTAARLEGPFVRSGDIWTRRVSEKINETVSDVWEYRMERDEESGDWTLSGRNYLSDETAPDFSVLATAAERFGEVPPNTGWSGFILCTGDGGKYVEGFGFFDKKGSREIAVEGSEEPFVGDVYEQHPIVAAQYGGWNNPPATQYANGLYLAPDPAGMWRVSADPLALDGDEVTPQEIAHIACPYCPPTAGRLIAGVPYRDIALLTGNIPINAHLTGPLSIAGEKYAAKVPAHYTYLRQFAPPVDNTSAYDESLSIAATSQDKYISFTGVKDHRVSAYGSATYRHLTNTEDTTTRSCSGRMTFRAWLRAAADMPRGILAYDASGLPLALDYTRYRKSDSETTDTGAPSDREYILETYDESLASVTASGGRGLIALASGRNEDDAGVGCYCAAMLAVNGNYATTIKHRKEHFYGGSNHIEIDETVAGTGGAGFSFVSPAAIVTPLPGVTIGGVTTATFYGSLTTSSSVFRWDPYSGLSESWTESVTLEHYRVSYDGDGAPPALIDYGWTHYKKTSTQTGEAVVTETWSSDPTGSIYEGLRDINKDIESVIDPGAPAATEGMLNYHFEVSMTGALTENRSLQGSDE